MTVAEWVRTRRPAAPPALAARIADVLGASTGDEASTAPGRCMDAAERLLVDLLAQPAAGRESALDLLTVDALVTYAFEAAADEPLLLEDRAMRAMLDIARLGASAAAASGAHRAGAEATC